MVKDDYIASLPIEGRLRVFLLWVAKQYSHSWPYLVVCPQLNGVLYWDTVSQLSIFNHHWAMAAKHGIMTISHSHKQHVVKSLTSSELCCHLTCTFPTWVENNKPKTSFEKRLETVFVWNCFLIIHHHLTWVIRELVPGLPSEDGPGLQSFGLDLQGIPCDLAPAMVHGNPNPQN